MLEFQSQRAEVDERFPKRKRAKETTQMLPTMVTQAEARQFIPPGSHIWISNYNNYWHGHLEPYKRVYATWEGDSMDAAVAACHE